jgi:hypothetical protein
MDYTERPESNQSPDETLFNFLAELYGVIGGPPCENAKGRCNGPNMPVDGAMAAGANGNGPGGSLRNTDDGAYDGSEYGGVQSSQNGAGRNRRLQHQPRKELPMWLLLKWQWSVQELIQSQQGDERSHGLSQWRWRIIKDHAARTVHEIDLGQNYRLQVHFLKVLPK